MQNLIDWAKSILSDQFSFSMLLMLASIGVIMTAVAYCILLERKISAWMQDRFGPNRVGPLGLLQPMADGVKFLLKEDIIPRHVDRALFLLAPWLIFVVAMIGFAVLPIGGNFRWSWMAADAPLLQCQVASVDIGLLYMVAIASLGVYGVVLGAWASNNKYSFYGGMRAAAQMLSYEVPLGMAILTVILATGELRLEHIVAKQAAGPWIVLYHPVAALLLFIAALAEANRMPFDLAESEQELIGGYHTEYSAMKLALFFLAEYAHMLTTSGLMTALFFGGYLLPPWFPGAAFVNSETTALAMIARSLVFGGKIALFISLYMAVRWTIPRFRFDQLMRVAWKGLVPISMALVALQGVIVYLQVSQWWATAGNAAIILGALIVAASGRKPITGRQQSLPAKAMVTRG